MRRVVVYILSVLAFSASTAGARPCGGVSADYALTEATLVVKGWLVSTRKDGVPGSDSTSVIRVERVLKSATVPREIAVKHFLCGLEYTAAMRKDRPLIAFVSASGSLVNGTAVLPASRRGAGTTSSNVKAKHFLNPDRVVNHTGPIMPANASFLVCDSLDVSASTPACGCADEDMTGAPSVHSYP